MKFRIFALIVAFCCSFQANAKVQRIGLLEAYQRNIIDLDVQRTNQSYREKGLKLTVVNNMKEGIFVIVDPSLIFRPDDTSYQDLILPGSELFFVSARGSKEIEVQTYCAKSDARAPNSKINFTFLKQGDSNSIKTFKYMAEIKVGNNLAQKAVWFLTDKEKDLSTVFDGEQVEQSLKLIKFLAGLDNLSIPEYWKDIEIIDEEDVVTRSQEVLNLHVKIEWTQLQPELLSLSIFDMGNNKVASYFENKEMHRGRSEIIASFKTKGYPKGDYIVRLYNAEGQNIKEVQVPLQ